MESKGKAEHFFEKTAGCGSYQVIFLFAVVTPCLSTFSYSVLFMSFGNYNPGWRCLDNVTAPNISSSAIDSIDVAYTTGSCDDYNQCQQVEFDPETSTIVTEWGLLCDKSWMTSATISIQMAGMLIFSFLVGQFADLIGRKKTLYAGMALSGITQLISAFSVSWIMFTVFLFFSAGISIACYLVVVTFASEVVTMKWRALIITFPFVYTGAIILAVTTLITKDWRHVQIIGFILHVLCFIPVFWVPESLRWLEVKRMSQKFKSLTHRIARLNKVENFSTLNGEYTIINNAYDMRVRRIYVVKKYTIIDIFFMLAASAVSVFVATGLLFTDSEAAKSIGSTLLISIARATIDATWFCLYMRITEIYPTVVRGIGLGYASVTARGGGILAPFVIPEDSDNLYYFTIISGVSILICCILSCLLPETKGKPLKDEFEKHDADVEEPSEKDDII